MEPDVVLTMHQRKGDACACGHEPPEGMTVADHQLAELAKAGYALVQMNDRQVRAVARDRRL